MYTLCLTDYTFSCIQKQKDNINCWPIEPLSTGINNMRSGPEIGVGVLVWRDRHLLLGKRLLHNRKSCWQFPGGHLETGETVIECAAREVREETGLVVASLRHLGFTNRTFAVASRQYITLMISGEYVSGQAQVLEPEKCECWEWFDCRKLPSPLFEPIEIFRSQYNDLYSLHCACCE
jgi:8-oxo-dGTP diphosphatase